MKVSLKESPNISLYKSLKITKETLYTVGYIRGFVVFDKKLDFNQK